MEIGGADARRITDSLQTLKALVVASDPMYPNIERWFESRVVPGLRTSERIAYVAFEGDKPIASAVLKLGARSKFCHLRINEDFQDLDLGQMFFTQMTLEARHHASEVHFTLPESLWCSRQHFFESFGFASASRSHHQYRPGDPELSCSASLATVWEAALQRLPSLVAKFSPAGFSLDNRLVISVKPKYVERIVAGTKLVEVRRRFSPRWLGCRAVLYASHPLSSLVGEATISAISRDTPAGVWSEHGPRIGAQWEDFKAYVGSCAEVAAIELVDVTPYIAPIGLAQLSHLIKVDLRPPQSYCGLGSDRSIPWTKAVAVATLLHGRFDYLRPSEMVCEEAAAVLAR